MSNAEIQSSLRDAVAIIGMAGRFPGARNIAEFWRNQLNGLESISRFQPEDFAHASEFAAQQNFVPARSVLDDVDLFDADFFGIHPREADLMDPQHRLFLETCWQALEDGAYDPFSYPGAIAVFAGCSMPTYFLSQLCSRPGFIDKFTNGYQVGNYHEMLGNSLDFLSTRVSYKLNLRGPSFTLQAGCSTSLVAVCQACQSLLTFQADMALAGGVSITLPQKRGWFYQEGGMISPDGHCRTFDAGANGTVFGSGVGVVLLKRFEDAFRDGDNIYAVIRGFGLNNDGSAKVGYTAPSVEGQSRVIAMAQEMAGVDPESIAYIEAHGTGTPLGDPIELAALTQAFRAKTDAKQFCALGAAKTNVGHLDVAAGITGLIHATKIVNEGVLPPTLHFQKPNPQFNLEESPFYVTPTLSKLPDSQGPRRAGVSAFGVGGTNAHVVIEQAPPRKVEPHARPAQLLILSARTEPALDATSDNLVAHLKTHPDVSLADVAWTFQLGRRTFPHRRFLVARNIDEASSALAERASTRVRTVTSSEDARSISFLFPGQGSQYPNMGREVYECEPVFRGAVDRCCNILEQHLKEDLRGILFPSEPSSDSASSRLTETQFAQPALFTIEYALTQLWMSWGVEPQSMLGHSVAEFVAACVAGVFSLEDALAIIASRGQLMQQLPGGAMLSVRLPESELRSRLNGNGRLAIAAVNSPSVCVLSGDSASIEEFESKLKSESVACRRLVTSHAFHSPMMDPVVDDFAQRVSEFPLHTPEIPFISCVSGTWITDAEATDPAYWARHLRAAVQFSSGFRQLETMHPDGVLLEVGPGNTLISLGRQHSLAANGNSGATHTKLVASLGGSGASSNGDSEYAALLQAAGSLWAEGITLDWHALHSGEHRYRVSLPTYPFERKRFWLDSPPNNSALDSKSSALTPTDNFRPQFSVQETPQVQLLSQASSPGTLDSPATKISAAIAAIFTDLSGVDLTRSQSSVTFLEMGFDSLFLTQVTQSLQSKFGVKITFRQLLGDQSTLESLTEFISANLPPNSPFLAEAAAESQPILQSAPSSPDPVPSGSARADLVATAEPNATPSNTESALERVMRDQLLTMNQLFAKQLDALRGLSAQPSSVASPPAVQLSQRPASPQESSAQTSVQQSLTDQPSREFKPFGPYKPPQTHKAASGKLSELQEKYVQALIQRCTARTSKSKSLTQRHRAHLADPRVVSGFRAQWKEMVYPIITDRSKGSRLWDIDGNEYIDILNGFGPIMLGHRPDFVERAIEQQLRQGFEIGPQTPLAGEVAEMFCEMTGNERMSFCNTGSEAVIAALRVARTVTGRSKVVLFAGAYHGMFDEVLVKSVKGADGPRSLPIAPGIPRESVGNVVVLDFGTAESLQWIRAHASELAAVLVEPVQSRHPNLQPVDFLREIREITDKSGTAFIFDEVVTGFRAHPGGCQALFGIGADLATYGKVLAGGMPIGVIAGKSQFMDALDGGAWQFGDDSYPAVGVTFFAGTFVRHPLTLAAVKAVLTHFRSEGPALQQNLTAKTAAMVAELNTLFEKYHVPSRMETFASIFYFSFPSDFPLGSLLYYQLREKGIYILEGFPCFLTTAHTESDIAAIVRAFDESLAEMAAAGIFGAPASQRDQANSVQPHMTPVPLTTSATPAPAETEAPLTEAQLEIWLSTQLSDEASCAFNESFTLFLTGALNQQALNDSLRDLVQRHDALRATIVPDRNMMHFASRAELQLPFSDLSGLTPSERDAWIEEAKRAEAATPFDLANGAVVRARLFRLEPQLHALMFTSHHIFCDGWSTNVLLDELGTLYNARITGTAPKLGPAVQFSEYALHPAQQDDAASYWREQFRTVPPPLELPTDRPRPAVKSFKGATHRARINADTYRQIKQAGAKHGCTLFSTLLSGFATLLHRLTSQTDIVIGIPTAGQSLLENGTLVGHCVNFLPVRVQIAGNQPACDFLRNVKRTVLDAYDHQSYTYGTLVRKLSLRRDPSRLPLVEVQFNLEKVGSILNFYGLQARVDPNPKAAVNFDLFLNVVESENGLLLDCDYNTDLFDQQTIARWLTHFETLLQSIAAHSDETVARLEILTDSDRQQMLHDWNDTHRSYPRHKSVHELIEEQAAHSSQSIAVSCNQQFLTYEQLEGRANQLARHLIKVGVRPGSLVGIAVDRSCDLVVSLLAIWKAGAAYVPLDTAYPRERLSFILRETALSTLVTQSHLISDLSVDDARLVCIDRDEVLFSREPANSPNLGYHPDSLAYVIFTSGSTGKPKGVEVTQRNLVNVLCSMREEPGLSSGDRLLAVTTLSFDIAALEIFLPLITGAQIILATREAASDPRLLMEILSTDNQQPTIMQATPATWRMLVESDWSTSTPLKIFCGGEALPRQLANALLQRGELWNMYGPTETTVWSATSRVTANDSPVTIGLPIANTTFYVLDAAQQLVPLGVPGELYIGGDGVARGYYNNPHLTSERFVSNPFSRDPKSRLYRTGDLVRRRGDGSIEFLGRLDNQVKIRGFRIELGEVESVLSRHPDVRECVVVAQEHEPALKRLVAYCVLDQAQACSPDDLRDFIAASLPDYMVPSIFIFLPALPHTPNGKIDRKSLPHLDALDLPDQNLFIAPRTPLERQLAEIVSGVLHINRVSVHDSLFDLGADSIHLFQIIARAASGGLTLLPQQVLRLRTIAAIAAELHSAPNGDVSTARGSDAIAPVPREQYQLNTASQTT